MSVILASYTNIMSVVFPTVFSRVLRAFGLLFVLCDTIHRVAADDVLLYISSYVCVGNWVCFLWDVMVCFTQGGCFCSLPGILDNCCFHRASGVVCSMGVVSVAGR
jgi:drug/metabolite transporter superfamily protein YnfA